jgi:hypothetical protein
MNDSPGSEAGRYSLVSPRSQDSGPAERPSGKLRRLRNWVVSGKVPDTWCFGVAYAILLPFFLAPLLATRLLPGLDLPFHIAAADMLSKVGHADSPYAPYYEGGIGLAPYAAHFVGLAILGKVMNLLVAHKLIIALYVAGLPLAAASLLGACRRNRVPALLAFPLAYNLTLHYGFVSFALSLPVVLWLMASMARLALAEGPPAVVRQWLVAAAVAFLLFLCHLQNFLYGICAALAFAVLVPVTWRRKLLSILALVPSFGALAWWHFGAPPVTGQARLTFALAWSFLKRHRLDDLGNKTLLTDLWGRILLIPSHAMRAFVDEVNVPAARVLCLILGVYIVVGLLAGLVRRRSHVPTFRGVRLVLAGLVGFLGALAAYLALPHHLQEMELMTFFPRFSVLVLLTAVLLVPAGLLRLRGLSAVLLPLPALAFGVVYGRQLYTHYRAYGAEVAGFVELAQKVPAGGKAMGLVYDRRSAVMNVESAMVGVPDFYAALRPSPGSMVPPAYCGLRHMPCRCKVSRDFMTNPWAPQHFAPAKMLPIFDYIFTRSLPAGGDPFRGYHGMVELVGVSLPWALFKKRPGPLVADPPPPPPPPKLAPIAPPVPVPAAGLSAPAAVPPGSAAPSAKPKRLFDVRRTQSSAAAKVPAPTARR